MSGALTDFQHKQLRAVHFTGDFLYRSDSGNRWPRGAWVKMIDALVSCGFIDEHLAVTESGRDYLESVAVWNQGKGAS